MAKKIESIQQMNVPIQTTSGKSGQYAIIGGMQYVWGFNDIAPSGTTLTFARAFSSTPAVICTTEDPNEQTAWVLARSTTTVTLKQKYPGANLGVNWIAIGPA